VRYAIITCALDSITYPGDSINHGRNKITSARFSYYVGTI
jgi:hypothetical protein